MHRHIVGGVLLIAALSIGTANVSAQSAFLNLPRASQHARVMQRIGITDITIDYHRPQVAGRGALLLANGQVWRAGANENTVIEFNDPVTIEGKPLPKGRYGLHMIPGQTEWVVIFSNNSTSWGSFTYDKAEDALRVTVTPAAIENHEALSYDFDNPKPDSVVVTMRWGKVAVGFKVGVNTPQIMEESLRNQLRGRVQFEWGAWVDAANYLLDNNVDLAEASKYADKSVDLEDRFETEMARFRALTALGHKDEAAAARAKAIALGTQGQVHDYGRGLQRQGHQQEALELFSNNIKKDPTTWMAHNEAARIAVAKGDFDTAIKEMQLAMAASTEPLKSQHRDLIRLLENKVDINK